MGNRLAKQRSYYYYGARGPAPRRGYASYDDSEDAGPDEATDASSSASSSSSSRSYATPRSAPLLCFFSPAEEHEGRGAGWGGEVVGISRRKGCRSLNHWSVAFRPEVDVARLPPQISGFRTRVPVEVCRARCELGQALYISTIDGRASGSGSSYSSSSGAEG
ncbi:hypothetical protein GGS23DRAFT_593102 [Durotheca rogersii]|uniref:uncharacterized protein n=1 Tax=Durotheca rogersii TaxID=419775 RepID=UPI00221EEDDB|nr:uncharacterized protein GGS23DRAFT_593102 [Durotheca rogersii]KAI5867833.1 hypothetical protein GGS23DRAFT_593102 [Durotheca rogersii]